MTVRPRDGGFALLIVLWTVGLLSLIVTATIAASHSATERAQSDTALVQAQVLADAAIETALMHLLSSGPMHWAPDGQTHVLSMADVDVPDFVLTARIVAETDLLNPNVAPAPLMRAVLETLHVGGEDADRIAKLMVLWRKPVSSFQKGGRDGMLLPAGAPPGCHPLGRSFRTIDDLATVPGLIPPLIEALAPHLSFTQTVPPTPLTRDPLLRMAFQKISGSKSQQNLRAPTGPGHGHDDPAVIVETHVTKSGQVSVTRRAVATRNIGMMPPFIIRSIETVEQTNPR
ncbi:general secretion pathway protein GspK [Gluconobacter sp. Dm-62]|uniref:type II secretion system protein GspK n=1 Tax=Gluconobacter sp. Dm-62 TaxID=2799804 RepID=UPI001B8BE12C|nr:type II secretion system protein GspK [Gluconobacter sp. Dm-62]MBS1103332.1 general secretion pathway protein GspK [Gluconobacter sp. Dm-62]